MAASFQFVEDGRDPWDRQKGEPGEQYDWFTHWRNDAHRRTYKRTADKFEVSPQRVARVAKTNRWGERLAAWKGAESGRIRERFEDLAENGLVPFAQAFARLAAHAVQADLSNVPADRALAAATGALRLIQEPTVRDLIRISAAAGTGARELDVLDLVLDRLAERHPDAHDDILDALDAATQAPSATAAAAGEQPGQQG